MLTTKFVFENNCFSVGFPAIHFMEEREYWTEYFGFAKMTWNSGGLKEWLDFWGLSRRERTITEN